MLVASEELSETFLAEYGHRLNAIGEWSVDTDDDALLWCAPRALQNEWVPFDLRFVMEVGTFDPDEEMFALWEAYLPRHPSLVPRFRRETVEMFASDEGPFGGKREVARACVRIRRAGEPEDIFHALEVTFSVPQDEDHGYYAEYDEATDDFTEVSCS